MSARGSYGAYSHAIKYEPNVRKETIYHEFTHALHDHGDKKTQEELSAYFKARVKGLKMGSLKGYSAKGKSDKWAQTFDEYDDYAGRIYGRISPHRDKNGNVEWVEDYARNPFGSEMATQHIQKLALDYTEFMRYWNDKQEGKYLWRECLLLCLKLIF